MIVWLWRRRHRAENGCVVVPGRDTMGLGCAWVCYTHKVSI